MTLLPLFVDILELPLSGVSGTGLRGAHRLPPPISL